MKPGKKTLLVAWDFTPVSYHALEHALIFSKNLDAEISLVHIVKKASEVNDITVEIEKYVKEFYSEKGVRPGIIVREGSIFSTINEIAKEIGAMLVIMGTHGIKGMQKLTGSWALKVIVGSKIPYIVVQKPPIHMHYSTVVLPVDFKKENKEGLSWAEFMGKFFKAKMRIITPQMLEGQMLQRTKANLIFAKKYLEDRDIDYEIDMAGKDTDFDREVVSFSKKIEADIILIMTTKNISFQDYMLGAHEQFIIANSSNIPVMCVNPRTDLSRYSKF